VILVGEIRDRETAEIAIQSALTGHLVFSTLHSNDACTAFTRLIDMGVEPYLVASTVTGVMAQRLLRVLCPQCKQAYAPQENQLPPDFPPPPPAELFAPQGCHACRSTGFAGRTGVFELVPTDAEVQRLCLEQASAAQIRQHARNSGCTTLRQCGWQKVRSGQTCVDEVLRVTEEDVA
jgi:general secretion pathway protein E/type IV pilus assembly protein PilB